jgi:heme-degrading monooxygenase HmoA
MEESQPFHFAKDVLDSGIITLKIITMVNYGNIKNRILVSAAILMFMAVNMLSFKYLPDNKKPGYAPGTTAEDFINLTNCAMETKSVLLETYTLGIWKVKPGMDKEFISEWTSFANWTSETYSGEVGKAYLLRDETDSLRFISFGPWDGEITIRNWRNSNEFKEFAGKIADLCDDFQPNTLKVASSSK